MRSTSAAFIMSQVLISLITELVVVESAAISKTRKLSLWLEEGKKLHTSMFKWPTNKKKVALMSFHKFYLILMRGKLKGTKKLEEVRKYGRWELRSYAVGVVSICNARTKEFIAIDKKGRAYTTRHKTMDIYFKETQKDSLFVTYHLLEDRGEKWYLAIKRKDGKLKRPSRTDSRHRSTEFISTDWKKYRKDLTNLSPR